MAVVLGHAFSLTPDIGNRSFGLAMLAVGQVGVDIFFVISGFIIANSSTALSASRGRGGALDFAIKRAKRIYPLYWIVLLTAFIASQPIPGSTFQGLHVGPDSFPHEITPDLVLLTTPANHYVPVAWTLCFEVNFYALITLVILIAPRHVIEVALFFMGLLAVAGLPFFSPPGIWGSPLIFEFSLGLLIAYITKSGILAFRLLSIAVAITLLAYGAVLQISNDHIDNLIRLATFGFGAGFLIYGIVSSELNGTKFPAFLQYLGDISYSLYMWHQILLIALATLMIKRSPAWMPSSLLVVTWLGCILIVAAASHKYIERGLPKWLREVFRRKSKGLLSSQP